MKQVFANNVTNLQLGRQGENLARQVVFDLSDWITEYGDGTAELIYQRPGDDTPYPVAAVRDGGTLAWTVSNSDTAVASSCGFYGHCELRWYVGDVLAKSKMWRTWVEPAMDTPTDTTPPTPEQGWVEQVIEVGVEVQKATKIAGNMAIAAGNAAAAAVKAKGESEEARKGAEAARDRAETAAIKQPIPNADTGTWWVYDAEAGEYVDSGVITGKDGTDGGYYTPVVTQPDEQTLHFVFNPSKEGMVEVPEVDVTLPKETSVTDEHINELIDNKLEVVENGDY